VFGGLAGLERYRRSKLGEDVMTWMAVHIELWLIA